jgi:hypothetical protein
MAMITKTVELDSITVSVKRQPNALMLDKLLTLEPKLQRARELMAKGHFQLALEALPGASREIEVRNVSAVCLLRMQRYAPAIDILRTIALNSKTNQLREDAPDHIRINLAVALFFGGCPAGGLEAIQEINREDDPSIKMLRECVGRWVSEMSFFQRLDWRLNRIAPKRRPEPPSQPLGLCLWDLACLST